MNEFQFDPYDSDKYENIFEWQKAQQQKAMEYATQREQLQNPQPTAPEYGAMPSTLTNPAAFNKFYSEAMRPEGQPSTWAQAQSGIGALDRMEQEADMRASLGSQQSSNMAQLASKGAATTGAYERAGQAGLGAYASAMGRANQDYNRNQYEIGAADEKARQSNLASLGNVYTDSMKSDWDARNRFNAENYKNAMAAWGAGKTADAMAMASRS